MPCEQHVVNGIASTDYVDCVVSAVSGTLQSMEIVRAARFARRRKGRLTPNVLTTD